MTYDSSNRGCIMLVYKWEDFIKNNFQSTSDLVPIYEIQDTLSLGDTICIDQHKYKILSILSHTHYLVEDVLCGECVKCGDKIAITKEIS